jgi:Mce-associated membrane protein
MSAGTVIRRHGLLVLAGLLLVAAAVVFLQADRARETDHVGNHAQALVRVFSFDHSDPEPTQLAADELLAGEARAEYDVLFASLEERAPGQKLLLTAQVQVAAVKELRGDTAKLLVFLDQASQRATDDESSVSAAQLAVDAKRIDGTWRITGITPL